MRLGPCHHRVTIVAPGALRLGTCIRYPESAPAVATWELRVGSLRVFYRIIEAPEPTVVVAAIGMKRRDRVVIGGEEIDL